LVGRNDRECTVEQESLCVPPPFRPHLSLIHAQVSLQWNLHDLDDILPLVSKDCKLLIHNAGGLASTWHQYSEAWNSQIGCGNSDTYTPLCQHFSGVLITNLRLDVGKVTLSNSADDGGSILQGPLS